MNVNQPRIDDDFSASSVIDLTPEFLPAADCVHVWDYHDAQVAAARISDLKDHALTRLNGDLEDDPGALSVYEKHRDIEKRLAAHLADVADYAAGIGVTETAADLRRTVKKLSTCRRGGHFGINDVGNLIVAWDSKCSLAKLCPDESRHEGRRLSDRYTPPLLEHLNAGGRVYWGVWTVPNYPGGRLQEGKRYAFRRFRNRIMRRRKKLGISGALVIQEDPLSVHRDWNIHLNILLLTPSWIDYKRIRADWGYNLKIERCKDLDDAGRARLFNELIKYGVQAVPGKSEAGKSEAPALVDWTHAESLEWYRANKGFRRTRAYGSLHGVGKPDSAPSYPDVWLGRLRLTGGRYVTEWRTTNMSDITDRAMRECETVGGLMSVRGDKSTRSPHSTGPPT